MRHSKLLNAWTSFLKSQVSSQERLHNRPLPAITISRQAGTPAHGLAEKLARRLNERDTFSNPQWSIFDKNLINHSLEEHQLPLHLAKYIPEKSVDPIQDAFENFLGLHPKQSTLSRYLAETILHLGAIGKTILIGRGSSVITQPLKNCYHYRLIGSKTSRIQRFHIEKNMPMNQAEKELNEIDKNREAYVKSNFGKDPSDPNLYHLVLNSDHYSINEMVEIILTSIPESSDTSLTHLPLSST